MSDWTSELDSIIEEAKSDGYSLADMVTALIEHWEWSR